MHIRGPKYNFSMRTLTGMLKKISRFQINVRGDRCIGFSITNIQSVKW